jgi:hypothetical protein
MIIMYWSFRGYSNDQIQRYMRTMPLLKQPHLFRYRFRTDLHHAVECFDRALLSAMYRAGAAFKSLCFHHYIPLSARRKSELGYGRAKYRYHRPPYRNRQMHGRTVVRDQYTAAAYQFCRLKEREFSGRIYYFIGLRQHDKRFA